MQLRILLSQALLNYSSSLQTDDRRTILFNHVNLNVILHAIPCRHYRLLSTVLMPTFDTASSVQHVHAGRASLSQALQTLTYNSSTSVSSTVSIVWTDVSQFPETRCPKLDKVLTRPSCWPSSLSIILSSLVDVCFLACCLRVLALLNAQPHSQTNALAGRF